MSRARATPDSKPNHYFNVNRVLDPELEELRTRMTTLLMSYPNAPCKSEAKKIIRAMEYTTAEWIENTTDMEGSDRDWANYISNLYHTRIKQFTAEVSSSTL